MSVDDTVPGSDSPANEAPAPAEASTDVPADATAAVATAAAPVEAAGLLDDLAFLLPFVFDPSKIGSFLDGIRWMAEESTWEGKWSGFKLCGDVAFPLIDRWQARTRVAAASIASLDPEVRAEVESVSEVRALATFDACVARAEAQRIGGGELIGRLRDGFERLKKLKDSPLGGLLADALLELLKLKLAGGLI